MPSERAGWDGDVGRDGRIRDIERARASADPRGLGKSRAAGGWFAARPSGTEDIYKIYAESFRGAAQLQQILKEAQASVDAVIAPQ